MKRIFIVIGGLVAIIVSLIFYSKNSTSYIVTRVIDGDTIVISGVNSPKSTVRYIGVNTPEVSDCFYQQSKIMNEQLVLNKKVRIEYDTNKMDQYGRALLYVFVNDANGKEFMVNNYLLQKGIGKYYLDTINTKYAKKFLSSANSSHTDKLGLWSFCSQNKINDCNIKGNIGRDGKRYYHLSTFRHYSQTTVNLDKGDQWFCTETEAVKTGWSKATD